MRSTTCTWAWELLYLAMLHHVENTHRTLLIAAVHASGSDSSVDTYDNPRLPKTCNRLSDYDRLYNGQCHR
jgi:hypothetical protein